MRDATLLREISQDLRETSPVRDRLRWEWTHREDGGLVIIPTEPSEYLFRGQNFRYKPCLPTISRNFEFSGPTVYDLRKHDKFFLLKHLAAGRWFEDILDRHPAVSWASDRNLHVERLALAQHYGVPTGYIDLTESFDVAAFFATCSFDRSSNEWHPCSTGDGIIYRVRWRDSNRFKWIGLQPMPRPAEQWGWTCELLLGEDFERAPGLQSIPFSHSARIGEYFLREFDNGRALFPSDPLARVAERIVTAEFLPKATLDWAISELLSEGMLDNSPGNILQDLAALGIVASEDIDSPLTDDDIFELEAIWNSRKEEFFRGVGFRLARTRRDITSDKGDR